MIHFGPNIAVLSFHCSEYLALFKKTVAMHEVFLQRIAAHAAMREDYNFRVFLEYGDEVRDSPWVEAMAR